MSMVVEPPYMAVGMVAVFLAVFLPLFIGERRTDRENPAMAAFAVSAVVVVGGILVSVAILFVAWLIQTYFPIFG